MLKQHNYILKKVENVKKHNRSSQVFYFYINVFRVVCQYIICLISERLLTAEPIVKA